MYLRHEPRTSSSVVLSPSLFFFFSVMRSTSFYVEVIRDTYILLAHIRRLIYLSPRLLFFFFLVPNSLSLSLYLSLSLSLLARIIAIRIHTSDTTLHLAEPRHPVLPGGVHDSAPYHVAYVHPVHDRLGASYLALRHPSRWAHCHPTGPGARP